MCTIEWRLFSQEFDGFLVRNTTILCQFESVDLGVRGNMRSVFRAFRYPHPSACVCVCVCVYLCV